MHRLAGSASLLNLGLSPPRTAHRPPLHAVLVCGDARLCRTCTGRASLAPAQGGTAVSISASAYEAEADLLARYPKAADNMAELLRRGINVRCGVDARDLPTHYGPTARFDRIVFNLPQSPPAPKARNQIQRHRALLRDFCGSARAVLAPRGELWITLLSGQGGTPKDPIERAPGDTWQLQLQAASAGLLVTRVEPVVGGDLDVLEASGYSPTGRRKEGKPLGERRKEKGLVVHVLEPEGGDGDDAAEAAVDGARAAVPRVVEGVAPLEWTLDNSFWLHGAAASSPPEGPELLEACREALRHERASDVIAEPPSLVDAYERPEDGQRARTFRFVYRSSRVALSRERALVFNARVCKALRESCFLEPRNEWQLPALDDDVPK